MANASIWDGTQWVSIMGPQGPQGEPGKDGSGVTIAGTATTYPPAATPAVGDMWIVAEPVPAGFPPGTEAGDGLVWTGTAWNNVGGIRGPKGDAGADGSPGAPGTDGATGADGAAGADGKDGVGLTFRGEFDANEDYANNDVVTLFGQTYIVVNQPARGIIGDPANDLKVLAEKGQKGADGSPGADGTIGADGRSVEVYVQASQPAGAVKGDIWIDP